jgi:hypothetical protein
MQLPKRTVAFTGDPVARDDEEVAIACGVATIERERSRQIDPNEVSPQDRSVAPHPFPMEEEIWNAIVGDRWPPEHQLLVRLLPRSGPVAPRFKSLLPVSTRSETSNIGSPNPGGAMRGP